MKIGFLGLGKMGTAMASDISPSSSNDGAPALTMHKTTYTTTAANTN